MRAVFLVALICGVLALMLNSTNAGAPPEMPGMPQKPGEMSAFVGRARRAAQGGGGGMGGGAGAGMGFGFNMGAGMGGQAGGGADGGYGRK